ncbi:hypothetical protein HRbin27_01652 [bacterium HR27]|nr:hypothetical protein HRbin27_01652 [bacterium HR27]
MAERHQKRHDAPADARETGTVQPALRRVSGWLRAGRKGYRFAVLAAVLALALASVPALAGPGSFGDPEDGRHEHGEVVADESGQPAFVVLQDEVGTPEPSETIEPAATMEPTVTASPTETAEPSATVEPPPTQEPTATVEPTEEAEPTETAEPTEAVEPTATVVPTEAAEPSPTAEPTEPPVRAVARDNHGAAVSEVAKSHEDEGNHGEQVRTVARDNHGRAVSEAAKAKQAGDEGASSVSETARDNHGAQVREAAQQHGKGAGGKPVNGLGD